MFEIPESGAVDARFNVGCLVRSVDGFAAALDVHSLWRSFIVGPRKLPEVRGSLGGGIALASASARPMAKKLSSGNFSSSSDWISCSSKYAFFS